MTKWKSAPGTTGLCNSAIDFYAQMIVMHISSLCHQDDVKPTETGVQEVRKLR